MDIMMGCQNQSGILVSAWRETTFKNQKMVNGTLEFRQNFVASKFPDLNK